MSSWEQIDSQALVAAAAAGRASAEIRDLDGHRLTLRPGGRAHVLFFVSTDCPISNSYAPDVQTFCGEAAARGVSCSLVYEDLPADETAVRRHLDEYGYRAHGMQAGLDADRTIATAAHASVTPQTVVVDATGAIRYRGRIDNRYAALGKPRQRVTTHDLSDAVDAVLAGRRVATQETEAFGCAIAPADRLKKQRGQDR